jgi:uncharacterized protein (UPF0332 family)
VTAQDALAQHRLARAREALQEADILLAQGHHNAALSRVYYAAFYAARAVLAIHRVDSSRHSGVIALFQQHAVRSGAIAEDVARALPKAFAKRLVTDYGDFKQTTAEEVGTLRQEVEAFVGACERTVGGP